MIAFIIYLQDSIDKLVDNWHEEQLIGGAILDCVCFNLYGKRTEWRRWLLSLLVEICVFIIEYGSVLLKYLGWWHDQSVSRLRELFRNDQRNYRSMWQGTAKVPRVLEGLRCLFFLFNVFIVAWITNIQNLIFLSWITNIILVMFGNFSVIVEREHFYAKTICRKIYSICHVAKIYYSE